MRNPFSRLHFLAKCSDFQQFRRTLCFIRTLKSAVPISTLIYGLKNCNLPRHCQTLPSYNYMNMTQSEQAKGMYCLGKDTTGNQLWWFYTEKDTKDCKTDDS